MKITWLAVKEKLRMKYLYIVGGISMLLVCIFGGGNGSLLVNGKKLTDFSSLSSFFLGFVNLVGGAIAIGISVTTIPKEYERCTHHLVLIRGISSRKFHWQLTLANIISSLLELLVMYLGILFFCIQKGKAENLIYIIPAFFIACLFIALISVFTSALSIVMPVTVAGLLSAFFYLLGICYPLLVILKGMTGGIAKLLLSGSLKILPNLNDLQGQASKVLSGQNLNWHILLVGLLILYLDFGFLYLVHRRESQE